MVTKPKPECIKHDWVALITVALTTIAGLVEIRLRISALENKVDTMIIEHTQQPHPRP